jgi:hypothetical protein
MRRPLAMRPVILAAAGLFATLACSSPFSTASAWGLYKGNGRHHSKEALEALAHPWQARLNLSGGLHGASDALGDGYRYVYPYGYGSYGHFYNYDFWRLGGYVQAGLEVRLQNGFSLEPYGMFRKVDNTDKSRPGMHGYGAGGAFASIRDHVDIEAWSGGLTLRRYAEPWYGSAWWGAGGGFVHSKSARWEWSYGSPPAYKLDHQDNAPEVHFVVGWEANMLPSATIGLEVGYRYTWLDTFDDFSGLILGARVGLLFR